MVATSSVDVTAQRREEYNVNFPAGSGVVVSTWISSVVVTVQRREDSPCGSFIYT